MQVKIILNMLDVYEIYYYIKEADQDKYLKIYARS